MDEQEAIVYNGKISHYRTDASLHFNFVKFCGWKENVQYILLTNYKLSTVFII
jgi:hypothetical protein